VPRDFLKHDPEDETGNWVEVACEGIATESQRFQRNRSSPCERVYYQRRLGAARRLHQRAADLKIRAIRAAIPVCKIAYELEQRFSQILVCSTRFTAADLWQEIPGLLFELHRTKRIDRVRPKKPEQHSPARRQRPPSPP
jgi:hypothetical protein